MKFAVDVNITQTLIRLLRQDSHDILDIKRVDPKLADTKLIKLAQSEKRIVLTHDKDFEALSKHPKYRVGVILLQLMVQNSLHFYDKLKELFKKNPEEVLFNSLTIVTEDSIEIKPF